MTTTPFPGAGEEVEDPQRVDQQRQAGDPESKPHGACTMSVHKNGGAR